MIHLRLGGARSSVPGSIVTPLLISDSAHVLPLARPPALGEAELEQPVDIRDRLVVDSSEWRGLLAAYRKLERLFDRIAVSTSPGGEAWRVGSPRSGPL